MRSTQNQPGRNRNAGGPPRSTPPSATGARKSRVPPLDAFDDLPRAAPPNLPGRGRPATPSGGEPIPRNRPIPPPDRKIRPEPDKPPQKPNDTPQKPAKAPQKEARRPRKPVSPAKRRRRRRLAAVLAILLLIGVGIGYTVTVLLRIDRFAVEGESPYTAEEVVAAFGHAPGENMFSFAAAEEAERLEQTLPYLDSVTIRRRFPSTVVIRVTPAEERYTLACGDGFAVLSAQNKVLRMAETQPEGLICIRGLAGLSLTPGRLLDASAVQDTPRTAGLSASADEAALAEDNAEDSSPAQSDTDAGMTNYEALETLLPALESTGLADITWVDVSDPLSLSFCWQNRVTVLLGTRAGLEEKLQAVLVVLTDPAQQQVGNEESGTLDARSYPSTLSLWFTPA